MGFEKLKATIKMNWYKTLSINQRLSLKELCPTIVGCTWEDLGLLFTIKERIEILYNKLKLEGIL